MEQEFAPRFCTTKRRSTRAPSVINRPAFSPVASAFHATSPQQRKQRRAAEDITLPESPAAPFMSGTSSPSTEDITPAPENAWSPTLREPEAVLPSWPAMPLRRQGSEHPSPVAVDVDSPVEPQPDVPTAPLREPEAVLPSSPAMPLRRQGSEHPSPVAVDVDSPVEPQPDVLTAPLREPEAVLPSSPAMPLLRQGSEHPSPEAVDVDSPVEPQPDVPTAPPANIAQSKGHPTTSRRNKTRNRVSLAAVSFGYTLPAATVHRTSGVAASDGAVLSGREVSGPTKITSRHGTGAAAGRTEPSLAEPRGRFSWHHACLLACTQLSLGVLTFHWLATPLLAIPVDHWCRQPPETGNASADEWKKSAIPLRSDGRYSQCTMYREFSGQSPDAADIEAPRNVEGALQVTERHREETDCLEWDFDLKPGIKTMTSEWNLVCGRGRLLSVSVVYNTIGGAVVTPLVGQMADRLGRRPMMLLGVLAGLSAAVWTVFTTRLLYFLIARMVATGALSGLSVVLVVSLSETCADQHRPRLVCAAYAGVAVAALVPWLLAGMVLDRRSLSLGVLLATVVLLFAVFFLGDESERWHRALFEPVGPKATDMHRLRRR
ncbi:hypothetical protein HPB48_025709 [Haemaphysalis longicornis]|uniref:Major facilitator superfamily (MFS) profile domain-containing protein n=1 Tax=Haemaphysalis longicornis TaxID=44386 RepID=A0A9J6H864_HAELO|nr:hypothetical protein HPB48_025709 [Haemaphysalis longicornis]